MDSLPPIPSDLLDHPYPLPIEPPMQLEQPLNVFGLHKLCGYQDVQPGRIAYFHREKSGLVSISGINLKCMTRTEPNVFNQHGIIAAVASLEEAAWARQANKAPLWMADSMYAHDPENDPRADPDVHGKQGAAAIICSPDANEYLLLRRGTLHQTPHYCCRLSLLSGELTLCERGRDWEYYLSNVGHDVAMLRTIYAHMPDHYANDMAKRVVRAQHQTTPLYTTIVPSDQNHRHHTRCYLSDEHGGAKQVAWTRYLIVAQDMQEWRMWCSLANTPRDHLRASFVVVCRQQLTEFVTKDIELAHTRQTYLEHTPQNKIVRDATAGLKSFREQNPAFPNWNSVSFWDQVVELGRKRHIRSPLIDRGEFAFIGGQAHLL